MTKQQTTCLVVGANGFIGSYLVDELSSRGHKVIAFDRFSSETKYKPHPNVSAKKGDILFEPDLFSSLEGVDYVFYSFSATTPFATENDPFSDINLNLMHSVAFFKACAERSIKGFYYLSSGGVVYGTTAEDKAATESDNPLPISPYGICKLAAENYLGYFYRKFNMPYTVFRLTNPYGPRQSLKHNQGVIPAFINKINSGEPITIYGDGTSSRDYIFISDAVKMMIDIFESDQKHQVYNIGSGTQTDLKELICALEKVFDSKPIVNYLESPKTFLNKSSVSIDRYIQEFGQITFTTIESGLELTVDALAKD